MKQEFSTQWIASSQPRKQRKYKANSPLHIKHKFLSAPLSKELRKKHGKRSLPVRKGDEVLVMRGSFKKKKAKIISVDVKNTRIALENLQRSKKDGTKVSVFFHPSTVQIQNLNLDDKNRIKILDRKKKPSESKSTSPEQNSKGKVGNKTDKVFSQEKKNASNKSTSN